METLESGVALVLLSVKIGANGKEIPRMLYVPLFEYELGSGSAKDIDALQPWLPDAEQAHDIKAIAAEIQPKNIPRPNVVPSGGKAAPVIRSRSRQFSSTHLANKQAAVPQ